MQVLISRSSLTVILMFLWRFFNALYLQDVILAAIFIDKTWVRFLKLYENKEYIHITEDFFQFPLIIFHC